MRKVRAGSSTTVCKAMRAGAGADQHCNKPEGWMKSRIQSYRGSIAWMRWLFLKNGFDSGQERIKRPAAAGAASRLWQGTKSIGELGFFGWVPGRTVCSSVHVFRNPTEGGGDGKELAASAGRDGFTLCFAAQTRAVPAVVHEGAQDKSRPASYRPLQSEGVCLQQETCEERGNGPLLSDLHTLRSHHHHHPEILLAGCSFDASQTLSVRLVYTNFLIEESCVRNAVKQQFLRCVYPEPKRHSLPHAGCWMDLLRIPFLFPRTRWRFASLLPVSCPAGRCSGSEIWQPAGLLPFLFLRASSEGLTHRVVLAALQSYGLRVGESGCGGIESAAAAEWRKVVMRAGPPSWQGPVQTDSWSA